jgi:hypothetical protein
MMITFGKLGSCPCKRQPEKRSKIRISQGQNRLLILGACAGTGGKMGSLTRGSRNAIGFV